MKLFRRTNLSDFHHGKKLITQDKTKIIKHKGKQTREKNSICHDMRPRIPDIMTEMKVRDLHPAMVIPIHDILVCYVNAF